MTYAVFDIDGTLVRGSSTERRFFRWLLRRGLIGLPQLARFAGFLCRWLPVFGRHITKKNKAYLGGLRVADVEREAAAFVKSEVLAALNPLCVERLLAHRARGDTIVLLSGTLEPVAQALASALDCDGPVIASQCVVQDGRYIARPPLRHPFGDEKLQLYRQYLRVDDFAADDAAYGDSRHDIALLQAVSHPVCVDPDPALRRHAEAAGWEILGVTAPPLLDAE